MLLGNPVYVPDQLGIWNQKGKYICIEDIDIRDAKGFWRSNPELDRHLTPYCADKKTGPI